MPSPMPSDAEALSPEEISRSAKRKRVALACDNCRERKVRCNGTKPLCGPCGKRGEDPANCKYTVIANSAKRVSEQEYIASLQSQVIQLQQTVSDLRERPGTSSDSYGGFDASNSPGAGSSIVVSGSRGDDGPMPTTNEQTLITEHHSFPPPLDASGQPGGPSPISAMGATNSIQVEPVMSRGNEFYGQSSVLSLLREVPRSNRQQAGPSTPARSNGQQPNTPGRSSSSSRLGINSMLQSQYALPPREVADELLRFYFSHMHILYPLIHSVGFRSRYESLWTGTGYQDLPPNDGPDIGLGGARCPRPVFFCALNATFALGCEFSDFTPDEKEAACAVFYGRMKDLLHIELLDNGSIAHVQALLLAVHYLLCTQYPTRCYNIMGLACRMAVGLGLHSNKFSERSSFTETELRRRVWYGCLQMEMTVSMTLGRPPSMRIVNDVPLPSPIDDAHLPLRENLTHLPEQPSAVNLFTVENIKLAKILAIILDQIYHPVSTEPSFRNSPTPQTSHQDLNTVMHLDASLEDFKSTLPDVLRWDRAVETPPEISAVLKRQSYILQARYLHLKILLFRPSFSWFCASTRSELQRRENIDLSNGSSSRPKETDLTMSLLVPCAVACVNATCELVGSIERSTNERVTGAWWFRLFYLMTSGTILILAECMQLSKQHFNQATLDAAWVSCLGNLDQMGNYHSQARGYTQSLKLLRERALSTYGTASDQSRQSRSASQRRGTEDTSDNHYLPHTQSRGQVGEANDDFPEKGFDVGWMEDYVDEFGVTPLLENWETGIETIMMPSNVAGDFGNGYSMPSFM
ncbi:fungal-specific transcription factor domain-containing protein [Dactylonectria estremocensis]|uniref:Fungal-specific transcription factor domain-containing protein n=1 Tax=Dactylonectria estremocensis TaxID=1079267 RepID=A0A9P9DMV4_9HYPO|nr:fungal-specific transcription factor domain-containing protein [Dactylonectria estremocensis]